MAMDPATANPVALLYPDLDTEMSLTRAMLAAVPWAQKDWKPHAKSMSLGGLATHIAGLPDFLTTMASMDELVFNPADWATPVLGSTDELVALFDTKLAGMQAALAGLDWARLDGNWKMTMGGHAMIDNQRGYLLRHMGINHLVHHRAQLGVYLRLLDVKIPGSYGPSADTNMG